MALNLRKKKFHKKSKEKDDGKNSEYILTLKRNTFTLLHESVKEGERFTP